MLRLLEFWWTSFRIVLERSLGDPPKSMHLILVLALRQNPRFLLHHAKALLVLVTAGSTYCGSVKDYSLGCLHDTYRKKFERFGAFDEYPTVFRLNFKTVTLIYEKNLFLLLNRLNNLSNSVSPFAFRSWSQCPWTFLFFRPASTYVELV